MKSIITWNVNGIRAIHKKGFLDWLSKENPDICCLQETKAHPEQIEKPLLQIAGYTSYWASAKKRGYSGLATYTKKQPLRIENLGIEDFDAEGRVQVIYFEDFVLINTYFPNSQEEGRRIDYKVAFCKEILPKFATYTDELQTYTVGHPEAVPPISLDHTLVVPDCDA